MIHLFLKPFPTPGGVFYPEQPLDEWVTLRRDDFNPFPPPFPYEENGPRGTDDCVFGGHENPPTGHERD